MKPITSLALATLCLLATARDSESAVLRGAVNNVPEAADYALAYSLEIPNTPNYLSGLTYDLDLHTFNPDFSRVAYYLELVNASGTNFVWVSFDAISFDVNQIGVPTVASGAVFQQPLANMNVFSSSASVTGGTNLQGGNIEFWPSNYSQPNAFGVPNASETAYDWGDTRTAGNYGCMQLHNADAKQVLLAFNRWGGTGGIADLGIGNRSGTADVDWTFAQNATNYTAKTLQVFVLPTTSPSPPVVAKSAGQTGLTNVVLTFSKPMDDTATNVANYVLSGGLTVQKAVLEPISKYAVTLTTTRQQPFTAYTVTINNLRDRTASHLPLAANTQAPFVSMLLGRGAVTNVVEAASYALVYSLDIPTSPSYASVPYNIDLHAYYTNFTRVAYYLELQVTNGPLHAVWVSMDAFTNDIMQVGVPTLNRGAFFQQPVANMNVLSTVPAVLSGTNFQGGNIEFWPGNYTAPNAAGVPNASDTRLDWGDTAGTGNYGSMQVHNADASQVIFAFNRWGGSVGAGGLADVGIGSCPASLNLNPDWTFSYNTTNYIVKTLQVYVQPDTLTNPPVLVDATSPLGLTTVILTFSKPLADSATNVANYAISGGVSVTRAVLEPLNKVKVTLTTTALQPSTFYTVTVNNLRDRTPYQVPIAPNSMASFTSCRARGIVNNVPEAADYSLVYSLDIPTTPNYANGVAYNLDLRSSYTTFTRVAYYLELQNSNGVNFIWVSMDPFTADIAQIGVPTLPSGALFQQPVANMNVLSSVPGIANGTGLQGGNIEFAPYNYSSPNAMGVPNANDTQYDWGDTIATSGTYGSMQIHNAEVSQVLLAFNRWGGTGGNADVGIGNSPISINPDWTFSMNAADYTARTLQVYVQVATNQPPVLVSAVGLVGGTNVLLTFNKALADSATNLTNYALSGGVTVLGATLEPLSKLTVLLTTSLQQPLTAYTVTVNNVRDRTANATAIAPDSKATFMSARQRGVFNNGVPEAANYSLVYSLNIPNAPVYNPGVTYDTDFRAINTNFSRIAYYLELQDTTAVNYIWVSMDAFTNDVNKIGVPTIGSGASFQQAVANMNVYSSVSSIVTGTGLAGGNIEFWPSSYNAVNAVGVPNASDTLYDWGDTRTTGNYGCMQIHSHDASQVLLAFNRWGGNGNPIDIGIGNAPSGNPDYTFANNGNTYTFKTLQVFVLPTSNSPPTILKVTPLLGGTNVVLTFSKPLDDSATNVTFYSLDGGLNVLRADLDPFNKYTVTLTTTLQKPLTLYTLTINGVVDRGTGAPLAPNTVVTFTSLRLRGAAINVPESGPYSLVYSLDIPNTPNYSSGISYTIDLRTNVSTFSRVAYYLELLPTGGALDFIWVSLDAFTTNVNRIGIPTVSSGAFFQQYVANVNVVSSVSGIVNGTNIQTGNMEFWPSNYAATNSANVPNASATALDWGDSGGSTAAGYGSMQIANYGASQMLFCFNRWGGAGGNVDLGIGNAPTGNPDWTFAQNAATYSVKTLQVFVLPSFRVTGAQFLSPTRFSLSWEAKAGTSYTVWRKPALDSAWTNIGSVNATNTSASFIDDAAGNVTGFYRISTP